MKGGSSFTTSTSMKRRTCLVCGEIARDLCEMGYEEYQKTAYPLSATEISKNVDGEGYTN